MSWKRAAAAVCLFACATGVRAGQVELISKADPDQPPATGAMIWTNTRAEAVVVSADARWVAFSSRAAHLAPGQVDLATPPYSPGLLGIYDTFLHDRTTNETVLVSHAHGSPATTGNGGSVPYAISDDSRWLLFSSDATDLLPGFTDATPGSSDLFLYDRVAGTSRLVNRTPSSATTTGNGRTSGGRMSADGAWIAFTSEATNLVPGQSDSSQTSDVFLYERDSGAMTLVSRRNGSATATGNGEAWLTDMTPDGASIAFQSAATNLVPGQADAPDTWDVFVWSRPSGATELISHVPGSPAQAGNSPSGSAQLSHDARYVAFSGLATNLVAGAVDANEDGDAFLHDRVTGVTTLVSHTADDPNVAGNYNSGPYGVQISGNGRFVVFVSEAGNLVPGQSDAYREAFLYDRDTGVNVMVSHRSGSPAVGNGFYTGSYPVAISADGRYVVFISDSGSLVAGQVDEVYPGGTNDVFVYDRLSGGGGESVLASHVSSSPVTAGGADTVAATLSADGAWIGFISASGGLVAGAPDFNGDDDVFLYEMATGENRLVSRQDPGTVSASAAGGSFISVHPETSVSADGRWVAFTSAAPNLVPGQIDTFASPDVFLRDRTSGVTYLVSRTVASAVTAGDRGSRGPAVTPDGRYVAFASWATNLVAGQGEGARVHDSDLFVWDRVSGTTTLVSHASASPTTGADADYDGSRSPAISDDGRFVAFLSDATNLVAGQINDNYWYSDVFLWDRDAAPGGGLTLLSHVPASPVKTGLYDSGLPVISGDGGFVAFISQSSLLASEPAGDDSSRLYLFTRPTAEMTRVALTYDSAIYGPPPAMSQDSAWLAFTSSAIDLVPGQQNPPSYSVNVFLWERATGAFTLVSRAAGTTATGTDGFDPDLSDDGRYAAFTSDATNLVPGQEDLPGSSDVFLFDRVTGATVVASHRAASPVWAVGNSRHAWISADGRRVAFQSEALDLVAPSGTYSGRDAVYVFDRATGTNALASRSAGSAVAIRHGSSPVISADGLTVAFTSSGSDLVPGDLNLTADVFAYTVAAAGQPGRFYTIAPCRLLDSRTTGAFASGARQTVTAHGACGIPPTATAVAANVTVTQTSAQGHLTLHAGDLPAPGASTINFAAGQTRANNAILPLAANGAGTLAVTPFVLGGGSVHVIVDVTGYFE